jgi:hypothetical protein
MDMEEANRPINLQFGRKKMTDPVIQIYPVLAGNIVVQR